MARRRRSRRIILRIDTWSVLKFSAVFYAVVYCIVLVAGVLLWLAATATGVRHNIEKFLADLIASGTFHFSGGEVLRLTAVGGAVLVVIGTGLNLLLAVLYNLISDLVGGFAVIVEEGPAPAAPAPEPLVLSEADVAGRSRIAGPARTEVRTARPPAPTGWRAARRLRRDGEATGSATSSVNGNGGEPRSAPGPERATAAPDAAVTDAAAD